MFKIYIKGGLGNQMFQYALYVALSNKHKKVSLDTSHIDSHMKSMNRCTIFDAFCLENTHKSYSGIGCNWVRRLYKLFLGVVHDPKNGNEDTIFKLKNGYLDGYWAREMYFKDCEDRVRAAFQLKKEIPDSSKKILHLIENEPFSVSIHVRLGDYETNSAQKVFGNICTISYYNRAVQYILNRYPKAKFFLFSNDIEKAQSMLSDIDCVAVDVNDESTGWVDMYLISKCKHNINANSTFSWWGGG